MQVVNRPVGINVSDLTKRIMVGAIYVVVMVVATIVSLYSTIIVIAATSALCCYEFLRMCRMNDHHPFVHIGTITAGLIPFSLIFFVHTNHILFAPLAIAFCGAAVAVWRYFGDEKVAIEDVALTIFAYLYTGLLPCAYVLVRGYLDGLDGGILGVMLFLSVCASDALAYLGGSAFGKHKFMPKISPKKSWEGVVCGVLGSIIIWALVPVFLPHCGFGFAWSIIIGILVAAAGIIGDLMESHIKRGFAVKDSGDIMPGHGGLLDRSDSLIFACVVAYGAIAAAPYINSFLSVVAGFML